MREEPARVEIVRNGRRKGPGEVAFECRDERD